jgi:hypothetical protein
MVVSAGAPATSPFLKLNVVAIKAFRNIFHLNRRLKRFGKASITLTSMIFPSGSS